MEVYQLILKKQCDNRQRHTSRDNTF